MREINFLTWNTQLYEMGNSLNDERPVKKIDKPIFNTVISKVKKFLESKNNAIAILQEIPFKCNIDRFNEHTLFGEFLKSFPEDKFVILYNISSDNQIKMTVVLAKRIGQEELIYRKSDGLNNNMCVSFGIKDLNLYIIGVHPHTAEELLGWLQKYGFPDIMLGDFNAGDYTKWRVDDKFEYNKVNYNKLKLGYTDMCAGQMTTVYKTPIDHVLIKDELTKKYQCKDAKIIKDNLSDHYPIYFKLLCLNEADKSQ